MYGQYLGGQNEDVDREADTNTVSEPFNIQLLLATSKKYDREKHLNRMLGTAERNRPKPVRPTSRQKSGANTTEDLRGRRGLNNVGVCTPYTVGSASMAEKYHQTLRELETVNASEESERRGQECDSGVIIKELSKPTQGTHQQVKGSRTDDLDSLARALEPLSLNNMSKDTSPLGWITSEKEHMAATPDSGSFSSEVQLDKESTNPSFTTRTGAVDYYSGVSASKTPGGPVFTSDFTAMLRQTSSKYQTGSASSSSSGVVPKPSKFAPVRPFRPDARRKLTDSQPVFPGDKENTRLLQSHHQFLGDEQNPRKANFSIMDRLEALSGDTRHKITNVEPTRSADDSLPRNQTGSIYQDRFGTITTVSTAVSSTSSSNHPGNLPKTRCEANLAQVSEGAATTTNRGAPVSSILPSYHPTSSAANPTNTYRPFTSASRLQTVVVDNTSRSQQPLRGACGGSLPEQQLNSSTNTHRQHHPAVSAPQQKTSSHTPHHHSNALTGLQQHSCASSVSQSSVLTSNQFHHHYDQAAIQSTRLPEKYCGSKIISGAPSCQTASHEVTQSDPGHLDGAVRTTATVQCQQAVTTVTTASKQYEKVVEPTPSRKQSKNSDPLFNINGRVYKILKLLGKGGSSRVYEAVDEEDHKVVAIKRVNLANADEAQAEGYLNEISMLKKLQGEDRIVKLWDFEQDDENDILFVVMEKGDTDLASLLKDYSTNREITPAMIQHYWTEMLKAVSVIHKNGIIHSDLKPANFLLVAGRLKLIDFGIASAVQSDKTSVMKDSQTGTFNFMSPEAIHDLSGPSTQGPGGARGKPLIKISYKSDVWSLGCILYNLTFGKMPFGDIKIPIMKLQAILNPKHAIAFPSEGVDPLLLDVIKSCLIREVKDRPSIDDLLNHTYVVGAGRMLAMLERHMENVLTPNSLQRTRAALQDPKNWRTS